MQTIKMLLKKIMDESIQDNPSLMAIRSWCIEILRLIDEKNMK